MAKRWTYTDTSICQVGLNICAGCKKPMNGQFRYRDAPEGWAGWIPNCKACSKDDPEWASIEQRKREQVEYFDRRRAALQVYINEFGAPDDDLIDECMAARGRSVVGDVRQPE